MILITRSACLFFSLYAINGLYAKDLHVKENAVTTVNDDIFFEIFQDEHSIENKRSVRHVKAVTETILDHIFEEFKRTLKYSPQRQNKKKLIQKFKKKLRKLAKKKKNRKNKRKNVTVSEQKKISTSVPKNQN